MDIISYAKAGQVIKSADKYKRDIIENGAEGRFVTVDERIDYLESQIEDRYMEKVIPVDLSKGTFINTEFANGKIAISSRPSETLDFLVNTEIKLTNQEMTANVMPFATASASSIFSESYNAYMAFNNRRDAEGWKTVSGTLTGWLAYEFNDATLVNSYEMRGQTSSYSSEMARDWKLEGSNDSTTWILLDQQSNQTFAAYESKKYSFENRIAYKKYRITVTRNNGNSSYTGIEELVFFKNGELLNVNEGVWQSEIVDLEDSLLAIKGLDFDIYQSEKHIVDVFIRYSDDKVTFTSYEPYDVSTLQTKRYIQIKIKLTTNDVLEKTTNYTYEHEENNEFTLQFGVKKESGSIIISNTEGGIIDSSPNVNSIKATTITYTMNGYLEEIERTNAINFTKLSFKTDTLMNAKKNEMYHLVIDVLNDDSLQTYEINEIVSEVFEQTKKDTDDNGNFFLTIPFSGTNIKSLEGVSV